MRRHEKAERRRKQKADMRRHAFETLRRQPTVSLPAATIRSLYEGKAQTGSEHYEQKAAMVGRTVISGGEEEGCVRPQVVFPRSCGLATLIGLTWAASC